MQKRVWLVTVVMAAVCLAASGTALAALEATHAVVSSLSGAVQWQRAGADAWAQAVLNQALSGGDKITTGADGDVVLTLTDGSTVHLYAESEFTVQTMLFEKESQNLEFVFGITKGKLTAQVTPVKAGSIFTFETPVNKVTVPASLADPTLTIEFAPDGSIVISSSDGGLSLTREGDIAFTATLETGESALIEFDPSAGVIKITSLVGSFDVTGPDGVTRTLNQGDTVILTPGGATFIPSTPPVGDAPLAATFAETASGS